MKKFILSIASLALILPLSIRPTAIEDCANPSFSFRPAFNTQNNVDAALQATGQFCKVVDFYVQ